MKEYMNIKLLLFIFFTSSIFSVSAQTIEKKMVSDRMVLVESKDFINPKSEESIIYDREDNLLFLYIDTLDLNFLKPLYTINEFDYISKRYISLISLNRIHNYKTNLILAPNALSKAIMVQLIKEESDICGYYYTIMDNYLINKSINHPVYLLKNNYWKSKWERTNMRTINNNTTYTYYIN